MAITGSVQAKSGVFYAVLNLQDVRGNRKQKWINSGLPVRGNKKKAEKFLEQQIIKYSQNTDNNGIDIFVADYFELWLTEIKDKVRPNTYRGYKGNMEKHIIPYFRDSKTKLQQLCPINLEAYYDSMVKSGLSKSSVKHHHQNISKALSDAVHSGLISSNPAFAARPPKPDKFKANFLTPKQLEQLLIVMKGSVIELPVQLCSIYGFRRSEVLGLKWGSIDFKKRTITISETLQQNTGGSYTDLPKNESSYRTLPLTESAYKILKEQKAQQEERAKIMGDHYIKSDYVCTWADGRVILPNYLTKQFHKILVNSSLPVVRFHDLRHSTASNLCAENVPIVSIADWLGHSSPTTTFNFYAHTNAERQKKVASAIDEMIEIK